jgi:uncharacterized protein
VIPNSRLVARPRRAGQADVAVFGVALAVLFLHATVDSFVLPEPGTDAGDHALRGPVSLALVALSALVYPRLRDGGRAALAGAFGALAIVGASLAVADARAGGARGEDWTGFMLAAVGPILIVLALVLLWRSRKHGRVRLLRRVCLALATALGAYWLVVPVGMALIATHRPRADVRPASLNRPYEQVVVRTADGLELAAWYVRSRNGAAVVSFPTRQGKLPQARMLIRHGYGVLLLDARGYDGSQGDPNLFGWDGPKDIDAAVDWLRRQPDVEPRRIGGIGFSVGGEMMLQAAAGNPSLRAVISEGAGSRSFREDVLNGPRGWFALPESVVQSYAVAVLSGTPPPPSLKQLMPRIAPRHVLLIQAGRGVESEKYNGDFYRAAKRGSAELWTIPEATHVGGMEARPNEYERRIIGFLARVLTSTR